MIYRKIGGETYCMDEQDFKANAEKVDTLCKVSVIYAKKQDITYSAACVFHFTIRHKKPDWSDLFNYLSDLGITFSVPQNKQIIFKVNTNERVTYEFSPNMSTRDKYYFLKKFNYI